MQREQKLLKSSSNGFSLIVVALIVVVLGAAVLLALLPRTATTFNKIASTQKKLDQIRAAVTTYNSSNGSYPCPARFNSPITNTNFGLTVNACAATTNCIPIANEISCPGSARTWVGAVPVRSLGLPDDYAFDEWGNRFTYVVNNNAAFIITDATGATAAPPASMTKFHAFSHGPDGMGSYLRSGAANPITCTQGALNAALSEFQNCNFSGASADNTFISRSQDTTSGSTTYYDDLSFRY